MAMPGFINTPTGIQQPVHPCLIDADHVLQAIRQKVEENKIHIINYQARYPPYIVQIMNNIVDGMADAADKAYTQCVQLRRLEQERAAFNHFHQATLPFLPSHGPTPMMPFNFHGPIPLMMPQGGLPQPAVQTRILQAPLLPAAVPQQGEVEAIEDRIPSPPRPESVKNVRREEAEMEVKPEVQRPEQVEAAAEDDAAREGVEDVNGDEDAAQSDIVREAKREEPLQPQGPTKPVRSAAFITSYQHVNVAKYNEALLNVLTRYRAKAEVRKGAKGLLPCPSFVVPTLRRTRIEKICANDVHIVYKLGPKNFNRRDVYVFPLEFVERFFKKKS